MCGFAGYYNFDTSAEIKNDTIRSMLKLQQHRGPNDNGILAINTHTSSFENVNTKENQNLVNGANLIFGFNRLSILDLSINGHQPMISRDKSVVLMMNGEIYNAFDFKNILIEKGYKFNSKTDTEVVLYLYMEYGIDGMLKRLNGMFAIAIYDFKLSKLFFARDRFGIKPLYILSERGRVSFSSELKSFKVLKGFKFQLDEEQLDEYLLFRNLINNTLFKNIRNCLPGTYITIDNFGALRETQFYNIESEGLALLSHENSFESLEIALERSVQRQMISDVKLGCQLSGGVDSSLVSYYAANLLNKGNLETISVIFQDPKYSEEKYIDQVRTQLHLKAHKYILDEEYYFTKIDNVSWNFEQPLNHPNTIGIYLLSQHAKKHVTVLLSGEGADEILSGYDRFVRTIRPYSLDRIYGLFRTHYKSFQDFIKFYTTFEGRMIMGSVFTDISTLKIIRPQFNLSNAISKRQKIFRSITGSNLLKHRKYEILTYLPDLLMRQDKMSMAYSIENRVPFLDNEMVSTSLNIPDNLLVCKRGGVMETKFLLKKICAKHFGNDFPFREKMGFGIPLNQFFASNIFKNTWESSIVPSIEARGIFRIGELRNITPFNLAKKTETIWNMLSFETWAKQYLD